MDKENIAMPQQRSQKVKPVFTIRNLIKDIDRNCENRQISISILHHVSAFEGFMSMQINDYMLNILGHQFRFTRLSKFKR